MSLFSFGTHGGACSLVLLLAAGSPATGLIPEASPPVSVDPAKFSITIDNLYSPMLPGTTFVYEGKSHGQQERVEVEITPDTRVVMGVTCRVVRDRVWSDGTLVEDTYDWFAQHESGDIWYFGEESKEIEDGKVVGTEGSWEAGVDGAEPGVLIRAHPVVGDSYRQEYYKGKAEDMAKVLRLDASVTTPLDSYKKCLQTEEWSPLEPGASEHKYYAPSIGLVREAAAGSGSELFELTEIRRP